MTNYQVGLLTTFLLGIFILIGAFIALMVEKKDKIIEFSIGLAFGVIVGLIITDLIPEIFENFGLRNLYLFFIFGVFGFCILTVFDHFIPDHHEHKMTKKEANDNLIHIGMITTLALVLHNIIEGMAVYSTAISDLSLATLLAIGVGFHNIPLGMVIASSFYHSSKSKKKTIISIGFVSLSTFVGGIVMYLFHLTEISTVLLGILLSITLGMLVFIVVDELFPRIRSTKNKKITRMGIIVGVTLLIISFLIG